MGYYNVQHKICTYHQKVFSIIRDGKAPSAGAITTAASTCSLTLMGRTRNAGQDVSQSAVPPGKPIALEQGAHELSDVAAPGGYSRHLVDADGQRKLWVGFAFVKTVLSKDAATMLPRSPNPANPEARWKFQQAVLFIDRDAFLQGVCSTLLGIEADTAMLERAQQEAATAVVPAMAKNLAKGRQPGQLYPSQCIDLQNGMSRVAPSGPPNP